jgi:hypothetical protein
MDFSAPVKHLVPILHVRVQERASLLVQEDAMNIVIAAEKPSIATLLSDHVKRRVDANDIKVSENPNETGSFFVGLGFERYVVSPNGEVHTDTRGRGLVTRNA